MKKFMKIAGITALFAMMAGANEAGIYTFKDNSAGGLVGTTQTYVYKVAENKQFSTSTEAKMGAVVAQRKVCSDPDIKALVDIGLKVKYIYVSPNKLAIILIDKCD